MNNEEPKIHLSVIEMRMLGGWIVAVARLIRQGKIGVDRNLYTPERVLGLQRKLSEYEGSVVKYEAAKMREKT